MEGYGPSSYGDAFADVYDEWYPGADDTAATVALVAELAGASGRVLELAVGTGRLAVPIAARGFDVHGVDASGAMLDRLHDRDPERRVTVVLGDMVDDLPAGPFDVALIAYNSLFNLESAARQVACFTEVAARLAPHGVFVVEAFVPEDPPRRGTSVEVRTMTATDVVLSISTHDPDEQRAAGHFVQFTDGATVRLRPWAIRYAAPDELDTMAAAAALVPLARWESADRRPFTGDSPRHVTVYGRRDARNNARSPDSDGRSLEPA